MNHTVSKISGTRVKVSVTVDSAEFAEARGSAVKHVCARASLPGFRPGKIPAAVAEKKFAGDIEYRAASSAIDSAMRKVAEAEKFRIADVIEFGERVPGADGGFSIDVTVDLEPEVKVPDWKNIEIDDVATAVTDDQVSAKVEELRRSLGKFEDFPEGHAAEKDDSVIFDYTGAVDGRPLLEVVPDAGVYAEKKGAWCSVDGDYFLIPGMPKALVGAKIGDSGVFEAEFPADFYKESLRGMKVSYSWTVTGGRCMVAPELTPELLAPYKIASVEELRSKIRGNLEAQAKRADGNRHIEQIFDALVAGADFDVPQKRLEEETERNLDNLLKANMDRGVSKENLSEARDKLTAGARDSALRRMRLSYIMGRLVEEINPEVSEERIRGAMEEIFASDRTSTADRKKLEKNPRFILHARDLAARSAVVDRLLEAAKPVADFKKK